MQRVQVCYYMPPFDAVWTRSVCRRDRRNISYSFWDTYFPAKKKQQGNLYRNFCCPLPRKSWIPDLTFWFPGGLIVLVRKYLAEIAAFFCGSERERPSFLTAHRNSSSKVRTASSVKRTARKLGLPSIPCTQARYNYIFWKLFWQANSHTETVWKEFVTTQIQSRDLFLGTCFWVSNCVRLR